MDNKHNGGPIGGRLLPHIVDAQAQFNPLRVWASYARSSDLSKGFRDINFKELAQAVNNVAWYIDSEVGRSACFQTVAFIGVSDIRYAVFFLAAVKCGYKVLLLSLRNPIEADISLLDATKCSRIFYCIEREARIKELKFEKPQLDFLVAPTIDEVLDGRTPHYPYDKNFSEAKDDPVLVFQTSGSTGNAKPIVVNNGYFAMNDNHRRMYKVSGRKTIDYTIYDFNGEGRFYSAFPPFHGMGIGATAIIPILYNTTVVLGAPDRPPNGDLVYQMMQQPGIRSLLCPPSILEELLLEPQWAKAAAHLDYIMFAGGPIATSAGDTLSSVVNLYQFMGSTEAGCQPHLAPKRENWRYFEFHPGYGGKMVPIDQDVCELMIPKDPKLSWIHTAFQTFPDLEEWWTRDLFKPHPTEPNLWQFYGRSDDTIVLSNGEKFNPVTMETTILGHPSLSGALVVGQGKAQAILLVESQDSFAVSDSLIEEIWPVIEKANTVAPAHGRIFRSKIIVTTPEKRFQRTAKGTIIRRQTEKEFAKEIEVMNSEANTDESLDVCDLGSEQDLPALKELVRKSLAKYISKNDIADDDDIFYLGLDSIQTIELAKRLRTAIESQFSDSEPPLIQSKTIYAHPNVESLASMLNEYFNPISVPHGEEPDIKAKSAQIEALIDKYTRDIPQRASSRIETSTSSLSVILTGSTGSLGSYLLQALLNDPKVTKVYCFNRSATALEKHQQFCSERSGQYEYKSSKVEFLQAAFGSAHFGLAAEKFAEIQESVDVVIHNAWKVDFNHPLKSFESVHIRGVRHFIDLSIASKRNLHIFFVSSIGAVANWTAYNSGTPTPESQVDDPRVPNLGYGEAKYVAERILGIASERSGILTTILRSGQIAGPITSDKGQWNLAEWLPSLIKTSKSLGRVPETIGYFTVVDWIPVDVLSHIILDIVHSGCQSENGHVFNLVNPNTVEWSILIPTIERHLGVRTIGFKEWLDLLQQCDLEDKELSSKPALKILEWFKEVEQVGSGPLQTYATANGVAFSRTLAELTAVTPDMMETWLKQWDF